MKIHQIYTDSSLRNFTYVIEINKKAYVVDPWCDKQVNDLLTQHHLSLTAIINTHEHWDHTKGNEKLVTQHDCEVWAHSIGKGKIPKQSRFLSPDEIIELDDNTHLHVIDTPGHCQAHLCFIIYHHNNAHSIFTGDILFNAGVGNCHDGDVALMYETIINKMATLPNDIKVLPGHEYLENNLKFTLHLEPSNTIAKQWLDKYYQSDVFNNPLTTTIADEKNINTFLRLDKEEIKGNLTSPVNSQKQVFLALRELRNKW